MSACRLHADAGELDERHASRKGVRVLNIPLWAVCLALAGLAPFLVGFAADAIDAMARGRTRRAFEALANDEERQS